MNFLMTSKTAISETPLNIKDTINLDEYPSPEFQNILSRVIEELEKVFQDQDNLQTLKSRVKVIQNGLIEGKHTTPNSLEKLDLKFSSDTKDFFSLQEHLIKNLKVKDLEQFEFERLEQLILDIYYPLNSSEFTEKLNQIFGFNFSETEFASILKDKFQLSLRLYLTAFNLYQKIENARDDQPTKISDLFKYIGSYFLEKPHLLEDSVDENVYEVLKKFSIISNPLIYGNIICREITNYNEKVKVTDQKIKFLLELKKTNTTTSQVFIQNYLLKGLILSAAEKEKKSGISKKIEKNWMTRKLEKLSELYIQAQKKNLQIKTTPSLPANKIKLISFNLTSFITADPTDFGSLGILLPSTPIHLRLEEQSSPQVLQKLFNFDTKYKDQVFSIDVLPNSQLQNHPELLIRLLLQSPNIEELSIKKSTALNKKLLTTICKLKKIRSLNLSESILSKSITCLAKIKSLKRLNLSNTNVNISTLKSLTDFRNEEIDIFLFNTSIESNDLLELSQSRPHICIYKKA